MTELDQLERALAEYARAGRVPPMGEFANLCIATPGLHGAATSIPGLIFKKLRLRGPAGVSMRSERRPRDRSPDRELQRRGYRRCFRRGRAERPPGDGWLA